MRKPTCYYTPRHVPGKRSSTVIGNIRVYSHEKYFLKFLIRFFSSYNKSEKCSINNKFSPNSRAR